MKVERKVRIAAPPEVIYDILMDPRRLADWVTIHDRLEHAPDGQLEEGSELAQRLRLAHRPFTVHWKVVHNEPARRVVWEGQGPLHSDARVVYDLSPDGDGTIFSYGNEYHLPGGRLGNVMGAAVKRVTAKELDGSLARLKRLVELKR